MLHSFLSPCLAALGLLAVGGSSASMPSAPTAGDKVERVEIQTEDRQLLVGSLYIPRRRGSDELAPAAILIHDAGGKRSQLEELAERLQKQGFYVLVPDLRGHGESIAPDLDYEREDTLGRERLWAFAARDVKACAAFLHDLDGVHSTNLSLIGYRAGAVLATRHAVRDENVRGLVVIEPMIEKVEGEPNFVLTLDDLHKLGGLPTLLAVSKDQHPRLRAPVQRRRARQQRRRVHRGLRFEVQALPDPRGSAPALARFQVDDGAGFSQARRLIPVPRPARSPAG